MRLKFDEEHYLEKNPDVAQNIAAGNGFSCGLEHWLIHGKNERREAKLVKTSYNYKLAKVAENHPKVSVVMSTYSRNKPTKFCKDSQVKQAIDSVLNQTFTDFELIIVDDASQDGTKEILEHYQKEDKRVKIYRFEENCQGYTAKRYNFAITKAIGDHVIYMCDDDQWFFDALELLISNLDEETTMVYGMANRVYDDSEDLFGEPWSNKIYSETTLPAIGALIKRSLFAKHDFIDESEEFLKVSDQELWCRFRYYQEKVKFVPRSIGRIFMSNDSISNTYDLDRKKAFMNLILRYNCFNEQFYIENNPDVADAISLGYYRSGINHYLQIGYRQGRRII